MGNGSNGNLRWFITILVAFAAAGIGAIADRVSVENRLSSMEAQLKANAMALSDQGKTIDFIAGQVRIIDERQVQNRQIIDQLVKDVDWLKKH